MADGLMRTTDVVWTACYLSLLVEWQGYLACKKYCYDNSQSTMLLQQLSRNWLY